MGEVIRNGSNIMDKSVKATNEAEKRLREAEAALAASKRPSREYDSLFWTLLDAERQYHAVLRAETVPRTTCASAQVQAGRSDGLAMVLRSLRASLPAL
jgi:hypothetical protein